MLPPCDQYSPQAPLIPTKPLHFPELSQSPGFTFRLEEAQDVVLFDRSIRVLLAMAPI